MSGVGYRGGGAITVIIGAVRRLFHSPSPTAPLTEVAVESLADLRQESGFLWLDVEGVDPEQARQLGTELGLDLASLEETLDTILLTTVEDHRDHLYTSLLSVATGADNRLALVEIGAFIGNRMLVTFHDSPVPAITWMMENASEPFTSDLSSPAHLAGYLARLGGRRLAQLVDELISRIDGLEAAAISADPRTLPEVYALRRDAVLLSRAVGPQRQVLQELSLSESSIVDGPSARSFDNVYNHYTRIADALGGALSLLDSTLETYRGAVADHTNEIVRVLTVFSATLLPLALIAGIWGMNLNSLPATTSRWGFVILLAAMLLLAVGLWAYFARRGFVGAPRLKELPRSVGIGLFQVGVAPLKVIASGIETTVRTVGGRRTLQPDDAED